jgi:hypothetical protein
VTATYQTHAQNTVACKPDYKIVNEACKPTDKIVRLEPVTKSVRVNSGACEPDDKALCNEYSKASLLTSYPDVQIQDVHLAKAYHKDTVGKYCGSLTNSRAKVDVWCDFEFNVPVRELIADESCPIKEAQDVAGCFSGDKQEVNLNLESVNGCLNAKPQSEAELWIKAACLVDAFKAQNSLRLKSDLNPEIYGRIEVQLRAIRNRSSTPATISQFIQVETKR